MANPLARLNRDWTTTIFDCQPPAMRTTVTFSAGTRVFAVEQPMGMAWAIADEALVARLTGNPHDARHRHVFVPASYVGEG